MVDGKIKTDWITVHKDISKRGIKVSFKNNMQYLLAKDQFTATMHDLFLSLAVTVRDRLVERWIKTQQRYHRENVKRVYYFSMEFLIGRVLADNVSNR
jgi:glycogen phosphorylase